jgi:predicted metalloprotease
MRLGGRRESSNIESQRGLGGMGGRRMGFPLPIGGRGMGIGGILAVGAIALMLGINPLDLLVGGGQLGNQPVPGQQVPGQQMPGQQMPGVGAPQTPVTSETDRFVAQVLATTEDTWSAIFESQGADYPEPTLVFYSGVGRSGCGMAQSAAGPFYCPGDRKIYLDTSFFDELASRFGAPGDFAAAYVIAHEVGHHVQTVTGISDEVRRAQQAGGEAESNALQVRMELQADCYAGLWGNRNRTLLEPGDVEEALRAAEAIGDDTLQRQAQGRVVPDSFTHGTSEQRQRWFARGYESGSIESCDTFGAAQL